MKPINFNSEMIRALIAGRKWQTRRVMKPQPPSWIRDFGYNCFTPKGSISGFGVYENEGPAQKFFKCPYGQPRDRLWVRETWVGAYDDSDNLIQATFRDLTSNRLGGETGEEYFMAPNAPKGSENWCLRWRKKSVIHMPQWASRFTLEITNVRVERVQDISEEDAIAEGSQEPSLVPIIGGCLSERDAFAKLWNHIYGPGAWERNDWVWVYEFKKL